MAFRGPKKRPANVVAFPTASGAIPASKSAPKSAAPEIPCPPSVKVSPAAQQYWDFIVANSTHLLPVDSMLLGGYCNSLVERDELRERMAACRAQGETVDGYMDIIRSLNTVCDRLRKEASELFLTPTGRTRIPTDKQGSAIDPLTQLMNS